VRSAELVGTVSKLKGVVLETIRHHHERFDGAGYPDGFAGEAIPIGARIIMISDTIDAMTTDRPYRKALTLGRALDELDKHAGTQFDPKIVSIVRRSASMQRLLGSQPIYERTIEKSSKAPSAHSGDPRRPVPAT
jgi:HD-GYP domain-containing protein (c-di-GMP phosphodiesterase class II)